MSKIDDSAGPCSICPNLGQASRIVRADGPSNARVLFIGEKPASNEHRLGIPFVGLAGREYDDHYLLLAETHRPAVATANACRCFAIGGSRSDGTPTPEEARICAEHHLPRLIAGMLHLELIVPMGAIAWGLYSDLVADGKPLEMAHGKLYRHPGSSLMVMPTRHPAAGMHQPTMMGDIRSDFFEVGKVLSGMTEPTRDPITEVTRELWDGKRIVGFKKNGLSWMSIDTEVDPVSTRKPWCLTFSFRPGSGYMVRADDEERLAEIERLTNVVDVVVMHYALYDRPILERMGVRIPWSKIYDTMAAAGHRGLPQALKTLSYRLVNMEMREYSDVVGPYAEALMIEYLEEARKLAEDLPLPPTEEYLDKHGKTRKRRSAAHHKRINRIVADWEKTDGKTDLLDRWTKQSLAETRSLLEQKGLAGIPEAGLSMAPLDEAVDYACADADGTGRCYLVMESEPELEIHPGDLNKENE